MKIVDRLCAGRSLRKQIADSRNQLYRTALAWCGEAMVADDLAQETLIIALQRVNQLRDRNRLNAWLYSILSNCWRQHLRRVRRDVELEDTHISCDEGPETRSSELEIFDRVRRAILKLPAGQRQTVTLVDLVGFSYAEVAEILDIPIGTVMSRLHTSRSSLQRMLGTFQAEESANPGYVRRVK
jgi:RNA polymerase sigma-70 factor (ECF subfamily)